MIQRIGTLKTHVFFAGFLTWTTNLHTSNQIVEFCWCHLRIDHDLVCKVKVYNGLNFKSTSVLPTLPQLFIYLFIFVLPWFSNYSYSISFLCLFLCWREKKNNFTVLRICCTKNDDILLDIKYKILRAKIWIFATCARSRFH